MDVPGGPSWRISSDQWPEALDWALWFRAAERIDVPAGGVFPGPAEIGSLPDPSANPAEARELAAGWRWWWQALAATRPPRLGPDQSVRDLRSRTQLVTGEPPDFDGLAGWPALRRIVAERWPEANQWHSQRQRAGLSAGPRPDRRTGQAVRDLEQELGRKANPFDLELLFLPVRDDQVRQSRPDVFLVPDPVAQDPGWPQRLRALLLPFA